MRPSGRHAKSQNHVDGRVQDAPHTHVGLSDSMLQPPSAGVRSQFPPAVTPPGLRAPIHHHPILAPPAPPITSAHLCTAVRQLALQPSNQVVPLSLGAGKQARFRLFKFTQLKTTDGMQVHS